MSRRANSSRALTYSTSSVACNDVLDRHCRSCQEAMAPDPALVAQQSIDGAASLGHGARLVSEVISLLGLDYGTKRIGVAVTDALGLMAHPIDPIENRSDAHVIERLKEVIADREVRRLVVGIPVNMNGTRGQAAKAAEEFARKLEALGLPVARVDERLTTVAANERLADAGHRHWRSRKKRVDSAAAALILESYMQARKRAR